MKESFVGVELGGSRSRRTSMVALDFFPGDHKIFLAQVWAHPEPGAYETADAMLVRICQESIYRSIAVHAPLTLPPCIGCTKKCPTVSRCEVDSVVWMRAQSDEPLPYVQRPMDLWLRLRWHQDWQESLGAASAPMSARMQYLQKHLKSPLREAKPKAALLGLAPWFGISARELRRHRDIEAGVEIRADILRKLGASSEIPNTKIEVPQLFLYETDLADIARDLAVFDAFLSVLMGVWERCGLIEELPFPSAWGSMLVPKNPPEGWLRKSLESSW